MNSPDTLRTKDRPQALTNEELAQAILVTWDLIRKTGTICGSYSKLQAHLSLLLGEQYTRAVRRVAA